jgi:hypothetical protein
VNLPLHRTGDVRRNLLRPQIFFRVEQEQNTTAKHWFAVVQSWL